MYQIKDWDLHFETAGSRPVALCRWCPVPNKQDGLSYRLMVTNPKTVVFYAVWCAIVLMCSKQRKPRRGLLTTDGTPDGRALTPVDIGVKTGIPADIVERGLEFLMTEEIGWVTCDEVPALPPPAEPAEPEELPRNKRITFAEKEGITGVTKADIVEWAQAYPAVDIEGEIRRGTQWLKDNPTKRKKNYSAFLTRWFNKTQEAGGKGATPTLRKIKLAKERKEAGIRQRKEALEAYAWSLKHIHNGGGKDPKVNVAEEEERIYTKVEDQYGREAVTELKKLERQLK